MEPKASAPKGGALTKHDERALVAAARSFATAAKAKRTVEAYRADWRTFSGWCAAHGRTALPAEPATVALYLAHRAKAGRRTATISRELAAISQVHLAGGYASPRKDAAVREVLKGIRRTIGTAQTQKAPLLPQDLREVVRALPRTVLGTRDRALLLVGFAGAPEFVQGFHGDGLTDLISRG